MTPQYLPVAIMFALAAIVATVMVNAGRILGPRNKTAVKFYLTAILFVIFDVEVVFMYPWAVVFRQLGWFGFNAMAFFIAVLAFGLLYEWRKGALEWD